MLVSSANIKLWSTIGSRATCGLIVLELAKSIENLIVLSADTSASAGLDRFKNIFPEKFFDVGIAEQNMMGIAAGLASEGMKVVTTTFAPFQTLRCCEQIKMNLGNMQHKVVMIGLGSGVALGPLGYSHFGSEDLAVMRALPGIAVLSPADCTESAKAICAAMDFPGPVYIRLTGGPKNSCVYQEDYEFNIGRPIRLLEGNDLTIFATGTMVHESLLAAEKLKKNGLSPAVVNVHSLNPVAEDEITDACANGRLIVTVEEHGIIGGLRSTIAEIKSKMKVAPPMRSIALSGNFHEVGSYSELLEYHGLKADKIAEKISSWMAAL